MLIYIGLAKEWNKFYPTLKPELIFSLKNNFGLQRSLSNKFNK